MIKRRTDKKHKEKGRGREGFTLVEMICVIAIMGILAAIAVPSYRSLQEKSAGQVALSNAKSNYTLGRAQQEMVDAGVMEPEETEDYGYDPQNGSAVWEGTIGGRAYRAVYPEDGANSAADADN